MARTARRGNVRAIRPDLPIPAQRDEDQDAILIARMAATFGESAYKLAQTQPTSRDHRVAEHMTGIDHKLPRNNLRLLVTPVAPREEWFTQAWRNVSVARAAYDLVESQRLYASHLDRWDGGGRAKPFEAERVEKQAGLDLAILDALRTPATRKADVARKQEMVGKRDWAVKYRPEWQAIIDEELERFPTRQPRKREAR